MSKLISLLKYISKKNKKRLIILAILILFSAIADFSTLASVIPFLNAISNPENLENNYFFKIVNLFYSGGNDIHKILIITILISIITISSGIIRTISLRYMTKVSAKMTNELSSKAYSNLLNKPYSWHIDNNSADIITTMNYFSKLITGIFIPFLLLINSIFISFTIILLLVSYMPLGSLFLIGSIFIFYLLVALFTKNRLKSLSKKQGKLNLKYVRSIQESIGGIREIILKNNQNYFLSIFSRNDYLLRKAVGEVIFINGMPRFLIEGLGLSFILFGTAIFTFNNGFIYALPRIGLIALSFQKLVPLIQNGYSAFATLKSNNFLIDAVLELLEYPKTNNIEKESISTSSFDYQDQDTLLKMDNVSFGYSKSKTILKNINLEIRKGEKIGIIGKTGSGKSTLLDIILGLLVPSKGKIYIYKHVLNRDQFLVKKWQSILSHVPQDIYLADCSIAENIAFGKRKDEIDLDKIREVSKVAQLYSYVEQLPEAFNTIVGERGISLSGGQKQRVAIARCLYSDPQLIILDEATSALDINTENQFVKALSIYSPNTTIIMVAHRLTSLRFCSKIIKINNGSIESIENNIENLDK